MRDSSNHTYQVPAAWQHDLRGNLNNTQMLHRHVQIAHEPACGARAPRRHCFSCDGIVFEFGIDF